VRMQKMIRDILTFSRVGREELRLETVDSQKVLDEVLDEVRDIIEARNAVVTSSALPTIEASPTLLRVVLQNLIGNALKFQDGSRTPEINVSARRAGSRGEPMWRFDVKDNGIGIDPAFSERIFAMFQRLHRSEEYPGTGIGLATCRKFIRLCGGDIVFSSTPGLGTTFTFTLPDKGRVQ